MFRFTAALALVLVVSAGAWAQRIARAHPHMSRPAGIIQAPSLPIGPGSLTPPSPVAPPRVLPRPFLVPNQFNSLNGFGGGYLPAYYGIDPLAYTDYPPEYVPPPLPVTVPMPRPAPVSDPLPPPTQPADLKARLTLNVPTNAQVFLAGKEVDAAATPVILESPELREGQRYSFDLKVVWKERDQTQERKRVVAVDAGDNKSLTYSGH
jgi:uncharacterized protein (TIGR03000 family)